MFNDDAVEKIYLELPFDRKDEFKALGAKWDKLKAAWYIYATNPDRDAILSRVPQMRELTQLNDDVSVGGGRHCIELQMTPYGCPNLAKNRLRTDDWASLRRFVFQRAFGMCEYCCDNPAQYLQDFWVYDETSRVRTLKRIFAACSECSDVVGFRRNKVEPRLLRERLAMVNVISIEDAQRLIDAEFLVSSERRNKNWDSDCSVLAEQGITMRI